MERLATRPGINFVHVRRYTPAGFNRHQQRVAVRGCLGDMVGAGARADATLTHDTQATPLQMPHARARMFI